MKKMLVAEGALAVLILTLTGEILVRRWLWQQIPTPIGPTLVYGLIFVDLVVCAAVALRLKRAWESSRKTGRS